MTDNLRGALFMTASMATFTLNDASIKWLAEGLPDFQVIALRGIAATALITLLAWLTGALARPVPRADRFPVVARSVAEIAAFLPFFIALTNMPLANITAILQVLPLAITAAGAIVLRERVGWRRWTAIGVGFVGVLLIVQPGTEGFNLYSLAALLAVAIIVVRDLLTRRISPATPSLKVAILTAAGVGLIGIVVSLGEDWVMPSQRQGGLILVAAGFVFGGYLFSILAMRVGDVAVVTPFRYSAILWGLLLGVLIFEERPNALTLLGAGLVVSAGLYTLWRETRLSAAR